MRRKPEDVAHGQWFELLGHPVFTGAVMVLAVNDAVLKDRFGTWWTGKLSDSAGVFVIAVLLGVLLRGPRLAAAITGVGFALLKLVPQVALLAAPLLGGATRQDPTDVIAIVAVYPAVAFLESRMWPARRRPGSPPARAARPVGDRSVIATMVAMAGGLVAVLATSATSCLSPDGVDGFVVDDDGSVLARIGYLDSTPSESFSETPSSSTTTDEADGDSSASGRGPSGDVDEIPSERFRWAVSTDGGETWQRLDDSPSHPEPEAATSTAVTQTAACSETLGCFRVTDDRVEQQTSPDGAWEESFSLSSEERKRIEYRSSGCEDGTETLYQTVTIVDGPGGEHVLVAMGTQGVLQRTSDGAWEPQEVLSFSPEWLSGPTWLKALGFVAPGVLGLLSFAVLALGVRRRGWFHGLAAFFVAVVGAGGLMALALWLDFTASDYAVAGRAVAILSVMVFAVSVAVALFPRSWLPTGRTRQQPLPGPPTHF